jgi:acyltransferase
MRICWVDNAKAIGIILVVYGHMAECGTLAKEIIFSFHMPLFFFLSGYLVKDKHIRLPLSSFLKTNFRCLIIPYFSFWVFSYLLWLPTRMLRNQAFHSSQSLFDPVLGLFSGISNMLYVNPVLWFFPCLFIVRLVFWWLHKRLNHGELISAIIMMPILGIVMHRILPFRLPWSIDSALVAIFFYGCGYAAARTGILEKSESVTLRVGLASLMLALLTLWVRESWHVEMALMDLGNYALFFTAAGLGIVMTIYISKLLPPSAVCRWLSENTIIIFPYHRLAFNVFTGIGVVFFGLQIDFKDTLFFSFLFTAGALALSFPVVFIIRRYMPWVAGLPSSSVQPIQLSAASAIHRREYSTIAVGPRKNKPSP